MKAATAQPPRRPLSANRNPWPNIKRLIYERDTTQRKVARAADMDETYLSDIIRGRRQPTTDDKRGIARALAASVRECFGDAAA